MATVKVRMDLTRALSLMGLSNNRWMDSSTGNDPKEALDKALFKQTQVLELKRSGKGAKEGGRGRGKVLTEDMKKKLDAGYADDVRNLHEAYQFLMQKYNLTPRARKQNNDEDYGISAQALLEQGGGDFFSSFRYDTETNANESEKENVSDGEKNNEEEN